MRRNVHETAKIREAASVAAVDPPRRDPPSSRDTYRDPDSARPADGGAMAARITAEQLRLLYKPVVPLAVNVLNAVIACVIVWPRLPPAGVAAWMAALVLVIFGRVVLRRSFWSVAGEVPGRFWAPAFAVGTGLTGALWGATALAVPLLDEPLYQLLIALSAAGMCAGAVTSLSVHLPSLYAFVLPCLVPISAVFLLAADTPHRGMGAMGVLFLSALILIARGANASLVEMMRLRFRNADLLRELSVARDMAEQASRSNWDTLAHVSHELRTPLNAIGGFAELMCRHMFGPLGSAKYDEYANDIRESAAHLTNLVEEILLFSRGHTAGLRIEEESVDAGAEIEACVQMTFQAASDAGVDIAVEVAPDLPLLRADPVKLRQIILNLLSNAIKFTPPGGHVTVGARTDAQQAVLITVADTGIGMDRADLPRVVEPYVQLESAFVRARQSGLGLGLPIVKRLVELHGGQLALESELGRGTTVTVAFPPERSLVRRR
ncbi:MAG: HAMP domain-containing histidine kinase [Alphaproteobacteria bacterium]|nr:HAMP domain-containing histidine kinase [Alphaproteobacteria bacterium]